MNVTCSCNNPISSYAYENLQIIPQINLTSTEKFALKTCTFPCKMIIKGPIASYDRNKYQIIRSTKVKDDIKHCTCTNKDKSDIDSDSDSDSNDEDCYKPCDKCREFHSTCNNYREFKNLMNII